MKEASRITDKGSSPHTWGVQLLVTACLSFMRIIPTYVGSTTRRIHKSTVSEDHPHIRGEYNAPATIARKNGGIIPTYVGSTSQHNSYP